METDAPLSADQRRALRLGSEPAWPGIEYERTPGSDFTLTVAHQGFSKRELLAGMAMQGLLARGGDASYQGLSRVAVKHADALLEELAK